MPSMAYSGVPTENIENNYNNIAAE